MIKLAAASMLALTALGCVSDLDTTRVPADTGSFGDTMLTLVCKRVAYLEDLNDGDGVVDVRGDVFRDICRLGLAPPADAPEQLKALQAKRDALVASVDAIFPAEFLPDLQTFLTSNDFLALYDNGSTIDAVDSLIGILRLAADDPDVTPALERLRHRLGYMPASPALGAVRAAVNYPDMHTLLLVLGDQITVGGQAKVEWDNLMNAASVTLLATEESLDASEPDRPAKLTLDLLLAPNALLGTSRVMPLVRRDYRGVAVVASAGANLAGPFVDVDNDGLADTDSVGRYVDENGALLAAPTPFSLAAGEEEVPWLYRDADGRALDGDGGQPLYDYVDIDKTMFAALARDGIQLFDPQKGTALDLLRGTSALMGPRQTATRTYDNGATIEYRGFESAQSPLLDMLFGTFQMLRDPTIYDALALTKAIFTDHEPEVARLVEAIVDTARVGDLYPAALLEEGSPIFDDMVPVLQKILATPGLTEDLLTAMEAPQVAKLGARFSNYMKYKDGFGIDSGTQQVTGSFSTVVDRAKSDSGLNRSLFQRLMHLINDSNGAQMCNKQGAVIRDPFIGIVLKTYNECDLLNVSNVAVLYVQSIAYQKNADGSIKMGGNGKPLPKARLPFTFNSGIISSVVDDDMLESESGIEGFRFNPTPEALNRVLFMEPSAFLQDAMDPARCKEGDLYTAAHGGTLPVWEVDNFYDQIRPIIQAFADHNQEQLFVDLLAVMHNHWPSRASITHQQTNVNGHHYAWASDANSYEPLLIDVLDRGKLLDALVFSSPVLDAVTVRGKALPTIIANTGRYLLTPQTGLAKRDGSTTSKTSDGRDVDVLSPWQILADAFELKRARLASAAGEGDAWKSAVKNLFDVLVRADAIPGTGWRFRNPRFRGITVGLVDFLDSRLRAHDAAGDRDDWLSRDLPTRIEDSLTSPLFAGIADFILSLQASPEARAQLESLLAYLVNEVNYNETFRATTASIADLLQLALDDKDLLPLARFGGDLIKPERGWLAKNLEWVKAVRHSDDNAALVTILRNLFSEHRAGHTAVGDLVDGISEVHRVRPWEDLSVRYNAADYASLLRGMADFLDEEKRGLRKFISIIEGRNL